MSSYTATDDSNFYAGLIGMVTERLEKIIVDTLAVRCTVAGMNSHEHRWDRFVEVEPYMHGKAVSRLLAYFRRYSVCRECGHRSRSGLVRIGRQSLPLTGQACVIASDL